VVSAAWGSLMFKNVLNPEWMHAFYWINFSFVFDIIMTTSGKDGQVMHSLLNFFHMHFSCNIIALYIREKTISSSLDSSLELLTLLMIIWFVTNSNGITRRTLLNPGILFMYTTH